MATPSRNPTRASARAARPPAPAPSDDVDYDRGHRASDHAARPGEPRAGHEWALRRRAGGGRRRLRPRDRQRDDALRGGAVGRHAAAASPAAPACASTSSPSEVEETVPVKREELRVEREPITDANVGSATSGTELSEEEHEVVLHEEEAVVEKRVVPKERVRLDKDVEVEDEAVSESVAREEIEIEGDADPPRPLAAARAAPGTARRAGRRAGPSSCRPSERPGTTRRRCARSSLTGPADRGSGSPTSRSSASRTTDAPGARSRAQPLLPHHLRSRPRRAGDLGLPPVQRGGGRARDAAGPVARDRSPSAATSPRRTSPRR